MPACIELWAACIELSTLNSCSNATRLLASYAMAYGPRTRRPECMGIYAFVIRRMESFSLGLMALTLRAKIYKKRWWSNNMIVVQCLYSVAIRAIFSACVIKEL